MSLEVRSKRIDTSTVTHHDHFLNLAEIKKEERRRREAGREGGGGREGGREGGRREEWYSFPRLPHPSSPSLRSHS